MKGEGHIFGEQLAGPFRSQIPSHFKAELPGLYLPDAIGCKNIGSLIFISSRPSGLYKERREFRQLRGLCMDSLTEGEIFCSSPPFPEGIKGCSK